MLPKPGILTREEMERLLASCPNTFVGIRTRAACAIMYRTGIRVGELLGLQMGEIRETSDGWFHVRVERPKGYRRVRRPSPPRELRLDARTVEYYLAWVKVRGANSGPIFCNRKRETLARWSFSRNLKSVGARAGITKTLHPHLLRHSFSHDFIYERKDFGELSGALGHRSVNTTLVYCEEMGFNPRAVEAMGEREW